MSQQQQTESNEILYVMGFIGIILFAAYYFLGGYMLEVHLWLRKMWIDLMLLVDPSPRLKAIHVMFEAYEPSEWTSGKLQALSRITEWASLPILGSILAFYGWRVLGRNPASKYKRRFNMLSLARAETSQWPWMLPVLDKDMSKAPLDKGPYAMAMNELEFVQHYKLLDSIESLSLNKVHAQKLFARQLGKLWQGHRRLRSHEKALYACILAQLAGDNAACQDGLRHMTITFAATGKPETAFADELIEKYKDNKVARLLTRKHGYVYTVLMALLSRARNRGKIPPSMMVWLHTYDRRLWYVIQSLDRRTPFPEAAGVYAHYQAEQVAGHAYEYPHVQEAVEGLANELTKVRLSRDFLEEMEASALVDDVRSN